MKTIIPVAIVAALSLPTGAMAQAPDAHVAKHVQKHKKGCKTAECQDRIHRRHRLRTITPYMGFLRSTGACESGTDGNLKHGLRAVDPWGKYRGRYQFGMPDWQRAGGRGDPVEAGWLEQAYRAVRWLRMNGRQSWPNC